MSGEPDPGPAPSARRSSGPRDRHALRLLLLLTVAILVWREALVEVRQRLFAARVPGEDPWGQPYRVSVHPVTGTVTVRSPGPDGVAGTDDDLTATRR